MADAEPGRLDAVRRSQSQRQIPDGEAHRHQLALEVAGREREGLCHQHVLVRLAFKVGRNVGFVGILGIDEERFVAR